MSTHKLRGRHVRVDRSILAHGWWLAPLFMAPFLADLRLDAVEPTQDASAVQDTVRTVGADLPLHVNERVEKWLHRFQTSGRPEFARVLAGAGLYDEMIRGKLRDRGMPEELVYLAMMESGLSPWAVSQVSAVGMWQFMSPTAIEYGLRVDDYVDERRDPVRATDAALDYLQWLYGRFDSWYLAAAGYNAGPSRVHAVLREHADGRSGDEDLYWEVLDHLPAETREYVPRIVAATILAEDAVNFGFASSLVEPYLFDRVFVPGGTRLSRIAEVLEIHPSVLRELNPHLTRQITPPNEIYGVRVPVGLSPQVVTSLAAIDRRDTAE
ncbi:MAG: lytic transglycosylase domain-containing protein [Gemmatimonadota bacterium]